MHSGFFLHVTPWEHVNFSFSYGRMTPLLAL